MMDKEFKVKITPKQARYVIKLLKDAVKTKRRKKQQNIDSIEILVTDIDIQIRTENKQFL